MKKWLSMILLGVLLFLLAPTVLAEEPPRAVFGNTRKDGGLEVMKTVENKDEFTPDQSFAFTLELNGMPADGRRYQIIDVEGNVLDGGGQNDYRLTGADGTFYLKDGQIARFPFLERGLTYQVSESPTEKFRQTEPPELTGYTGTYDGTGIRLSFVNEYHPQSDTDSLTVKKRVSVPTGYSYDSTMPFQFRLTVRGQPYAEQAYIISDAQGNFREEQTDEDGMFYLRADEQALFENNEPFFYLVEEILSDGQRENGWRVIGDPFFANTTTDNNRVTFVNTNASLVVQKVMEDGSDTEDSFVFHLTDIYERGVQAKYYLYDIHGHLLDDRLHTTSVDEEDVSEDGEFTLKANQAAYFVGLEQGRKYNVYEEFMAGYVQRVPATSTGYDVEIKPRAEILTFKNDRQSLKGVLKVNKHVTDLVPSETAPTDQRFTFRLLRLEGESDWVPVEGASYTVNEGVDTLTRSTDEGGKFFIKKNETAVFRYLTKQRQYKVVEEVLASSEYKDHTNGGLTGELTSENYLNFIYENLYRPEMTDIVLTKVDENSRNPLAGARFTVYTNAEMTKVLAESEDSNQNGKIYFYNLKEGTYYLKETKAPLYYDLDHTVIKLRVFRDEESGRLDVAYTVGDGEEVSAVHREELSDNLGVPYFILSTQTDDNGFMVNSCFYAAVTNHHAGTLPHAGGMLLWFRIAGWLLAALGAYGFFRSRRHKKTI